MTWPWDNEQLGALFEGPRGFTALGPRGGSRAPIGRATKSGSRRQKLSELSMAKPEASLARGFAVGANCSAKKKVFPRSGRNEEGFPFWMRI